jgi:hypothetical protein
MNASQPANDQGITHVVYDKTTGRIVGTLRHFDLASKEYRNSDPDKVLELFASDKVAMSKVTDGDIRNLAMTATELPVNARVSTLRFSAQRQSLVMLPRLRLRADREVIEGDGIDSVTLYLDVIGEDGRLIRGYRNEVHVTTSRGKLSTKAGRVNVEAGQGSVVLTSARETVDRVEVKAKTLDGSAVSDEMTLSFE